MEAIYVLVVSGEQDAELFEQIIQRSSAHAVVTCIRNESELESYLTATVPACVVVDWRSEFVQPELFSRSLSRRLHRPDVSLVAIVTTTDQLYLAYKAGYDFVIMLEYTRATYYAVSSVVRLVEQVWRSRRQQENLGAEVQRLQTLCEHWINVVERIVAGRIPEAPLVATFVRHSSLWIAERLCTIVPGNAIDMAQLDLAARLYALGRIHLLDTDVQRAVATDGVPSTYGTATVPERAAELLDVLVEYPQTRLFLLTMYENYDGTGFPHRRQGWHIPLGARILRVTVDYAEMLYRDAVPATEALSRLQQLSHHLYDQRVVVLLDEYVTTSAPDFDTSLVIPLRVESLSSGMTLGRDIVTASGHKLAAAGTTLSAVHVERIIAHHAVDPVLGSVYVLRQ